jgi:outer membrane immunogenic protein
MLKTGVSAIALGIIGIAAMPPALTSAAHAADVIMPTVVRPQPYFGPPKSFPRWEGWYAGVALGADWLRLDNDVFGNGRTGFSGTVFAGYDWQFRALGQTFVAGPLVDFNYSTAKARVSPSLSTAGFSGDVRQTWSGDIGLRAGWSPTSQTLVYVSGGGAFGWADATLRDPFGSLTTISSSPGVGWFAGVGAETYVSRNITVRAEYRFGESDLGGSRLRDQRGMIGIAWRR